MDLGDLEQHIQGMYKHFDDQIGFSRPPTLFLDSDPSNAPNTLGKTAYYDPQTFEIHVYTDGRHPKDMLRSIAHELIHHQQNLEGRLDVGGYHGEGYYLHNEALKELEQEAMLQGNHYLREYEDTLKTQENQMSLKEWKNKELFENLMGKWGIKTNILNEKLGDGKTQGTDSVEAGLDKNPEFTRADLGAEQGGARGEGELEEAAVSIDDEFKKDYVNLKYGKKERSPEKIEQDYATLVQGKPDGRPTIEELEKMAEKGNKTAKKLAADLKSTEKPEQLDEAEHKCPECEGKGEECKCPKKEEIEETSVAAGVQGAVSREDLQESINSILKENKKLIKRLLK